MPTARQLMEAELRDKALAASQTSTLGGSPGPLINYNDPYSHARQTHPNLYKLLGNGDAWKNWVDSMYQGGGLSMGGPNGMSEDALRRYLAKTVPWEKQQQTLPTKVRQAPQGTRRTKAVPGAMGPLQQPTGTPSRRDLKRAASFAGLNGGMPDMALMTMLTTMYDQNNKNKAVKKRENELRQSMAELYDRTMGAYDTLGDTQRREIEQSYDDAYSTGQARRGQVGLNNSTIETAFQQRSEKEKKNAKTSLEEDLTRMKSEADINLTRDKQRMIESIVDKSPDLGGMLNLMMQMGASGYGAPQAPTMPAAAPTAAAAPAKANQQPMHSQLPMVFSGAPISMGTLNPMAPIMAQQGMVNAIAGMPQPTVPTYSKRKRKQKDEGVMNRLNLTNPLGADGRLNMNLVGRTPQFNMVENAQNQGWNMLSHLPNQGRPTPQFNMVENALRQRQPQTGYPLYASGLPVPGPWSMDPNAWKY